MLGIPLRYMLKHPLTASADLAADRFEMLTTLPDAYIAEREQRRPQCPYRHDPDWEQRLHEHIGVSWPCEVTAEFRSLWPEIIDVGSSVGTSSTAYSPISFGKPSTSITGACTVPWKYAFSGHLWPKMSV
jgi:hypothetical protein